MEMSRKSEWVGQWGWDGWSLGEGVEDYGSQDFGAEEMWRIQVTRSSNFQGIISACAAQSLAACVSSARRRPLC